MEVDIHKVYASDIAVPCGSVIQLHCLQVCCGSELGRTRHSLRDLGLDMLTSDRDVEVVQDMEGLHYSIESRGPFRGCSLEECGTDES